ncbi:tetratricopeptide repeat protein [Sulfurimonas sp.]
MHNFYDLQKRCKQYKRKKILKYLLLSAIVLLSFIGLYFYVQQNTPSPVPTKTKIQKIIKKTIKKTTPQHKTSLKKEKKTIVKKEKTITKHIAKKYSLQFLVVKKENIHQAKKRKKILEYIGFKNCKLTPHSKYIYLTCNEVDNIKKLSPYIKLAKRKKIDYYIDTQYSPIKNTLKVKKKVPKKTPKVERTQAPMLKVQNINLKELQKSFSQTPSYNIALLIARNYYANKAYKKAINWAKKANQLNKDDAASWMIYAKSLYALKRTKQAKQLLRIYLQYENSEDATHLLKQWENQ